MSARGLATAVYEPGKGFVSSTQEIVDDLRNGRMVILVDAEEKENEGDLVIPAQMATPDAINFMAKHGRGLICLSLTKERADRLRLEPQARRNASGTGTAFTVSIEAREGVTTGISAADRARTIATAIDPTKGADDLVSPGHVFPLVARDGGVLIRSGHTEASIDLCRLAGLMPAAVICEIMNDDGTMARLADLVAFAQRHGLKVGTIESLISHRLRHDRMVRRTATKRIDSQFGGAFDLHLFETTIDNVEHLALVKGDLARGGPVLVRVHAVNAMSDLLGVGDQAAAISVAMRTIEAEGRGVLVLIRDLRPHALSEALAGRPTGHQAKTGHERRLVEVGIGSQILRDLGVEDMILLSNTAGQVYVGLESYGLRIVGQRKIG